MDHQNSKGHSNGQPHPFTILQHGIEIKENIQNEIFELISILKRRELELCLEVDQQCLELVCETEEMGSASVFNHPNGEVDEPIQYIKNRQDLLPSKLKFTGDFNFYEQILKKYGNIQKIDCWKNVMCKPKTNHQLPEDIKNIFKGEKLEIINFEDREEKESSISSNSFEVIDSVCCCPKMMMEDEKECSSRLNDWKKTVQENLKGKKHLNMLDHASYCSADSFENCESPVEKKVKEINYCQKMRDAPGYKPQLAACMSPETVLRAKLSNKRPHHSSLACQTCASRLQRKNEWLADVGQKSPETSTDECCDMFSEISVTPAPCKSHLGCPADDDNPQSTIKACFGAYLEKNDLKSWLNPNHSSGEIDTTLCEEWVAKVSLSDKEEVDAWSPIVITEDMVNSFCFIKPKNH